MIIMHIIGFGRKAREVYPPRIVPPQQSFARNAATGPAANTAVATASGAQISWSVVENGAAGADVPITPTATGIVRVTAVIVLHETLGNTDRFVQARVQVGGTDKTVTTSIVSMPASGYATLTLDVIIGAGANAPPLTLNAVSNIQVRIDANNSGVELVATDSSINVQEVPAAA